MHLHPTTGRVALRGAAVVTASLAVVLAGALPASARMESGSTVHDITWSFTSGVSGTLTSANSYAHLDDMRDPIQMDRVVAKPDNGESLQVGTEACTPGNYNSSAVTLYGQNPDWYNASLHGPQGMYLTVTCRHQDGTQHRYRWGCVKPTSYCVTLTRTAEGFDLQATSDCVMEDHVIAKNGKATRLNTPTIPFTATIAVHPS